jgi:hypothetical protein
MNGREYERTELPGAEVVSCWDDGPMDPISMEAATTPTNPDPSFSTRRLGRVNEGSAAASVCGSCQRPCGQAHSAGSESGTRLVARVGRGTPQFPRRLGVAGAPRRRDR